MGSRFSYNGILIYSDNNYLRRFYDEICEGKIWISSSSTIDISYNTVMVLLEKGFVKPNVFVASSADDHSFDWEDYCNENCFSYFRKNDVEGLPLKLYHIKETPAFYQLIRGDDISFECRILDAAREQKSRQFVWNEVISKLNSNDILNTSPDLIDLRAVLKQPL